MVAIAVTSKLTASGITVAVQEGVHFLLQHHGQHLPSRLADVIFQGILNLTPFLLLTFRSQV